ncbi:Modification methylase DpnIIA [Legionella spiritensis]|nr:Modification methylase DpnIIA [Legionella spiritensis]
MDTYNIKLNENHGGPLRYLGNRYLSLPEVSGHMRVDNSWLNEHFSVLLANNRGQKYKRTFEPFAGCASWSLAAMEIDLAEEYIINDSNKILINTLQLIKEKPDFVKQSYALLIRGYATSTSKKDFFLETIDKYNISNSEEEKSLLLPFIINHSWSGILFYDHEFNIIYKESNLFEGKKSERFLNEAGLSLDEFFSEIDRTSNLLNNHNVIFKTGDFIDAISDVLAGDFVALNPPYPENERSDVEQSSMYLELYSLEKLHQNIVQTIQRLESHNIHYYMTYGFYNPKLKNYVLHDGKNQPINYFRILGYEQCAFGIGLDQLYLTSQFAIPPSASSSILRARDVLEKNNLTVEEALQNFNRISKNKFSI